MALDPRRAAKRQEFGYTDSEGNQRTMTADGDGLIRPRDAEAAAVLDTFDLPVARVTSKKKTTQPESGPDETVAESAEEPKE